MRGDPRSGNHYAKTCLFQSTPLHEGRLQTAHRNPRVSGFNPHPCIRGDLSKQRRGGLVHGFNPRPRMRGDVAALQYLSKRDSFQSTPPHEGRLVHQLYYKPEFQRFNPRPRMRGDTKKFIEELKKEGFNPRPRMRGD